jgi:hypothetical protein
LNAEFSVFVDCIVVTLKQVNQFLRRILGDFVSTRGSRAKCKIIRDVGPLPLIINVDVKRGIYDLPKYGIRGGN